MAWAGFLFVILLVATVFLVPGSPAGDASAATVASFYHQHKSLTYASAYLTEAAMCVALIFFWYLREYLSATPASRPLSTLGYAGAVLFTSSGGVSAGLAWALADSADHVPASTMQTLSILQNDLGTFLGGAGAAVFLIATGIAVVRSAVLARWAGWTAIAFGIIDLVFPSPAAATAGLWVIIACVAILVRERRGRASRDPQPQTVAPAA